MQNPNYWGPGSSGHQKQDQYWKNDAQQNKYSNSWYGKQQYATDSTTNSYVSYYQNANDEKPYESCTEYFTYPQESTSVASNTETALQSTSTAESHVASSPSIPSRDPRTRRHTMTASPHSHQTASVSTLITNHTVQQPNTSSQLHSSPSNRSTASSSTKLNTYISKHYSSNSYSTSNCTSNPARNRMYRSPSYFRQRSSPIRNRFEELSPYIKSDLSIPSYSTASPEIPEVVNSNQTGTIKERMHFAPKILPDTSKISNLTFEQTKRMSSVRQHSQTNFSIHSRPLPEKPKPSSFIRQRSHSNSTDSKGTKIVPEKLQTSSVVSAGKDSDTGYVRHKSQAKVTTESVPSTEKEKSIQNLLSKFFTEEESNKPISKTKADNMTKKSLSEVKDYPDNKRKLSMKQIRPKTRLSLKDEENENEESVNNLETLKRNIHSHNISNKDKSNLLLGESKVKHGMKKKKQHKFGKQTIEEILFAMENSGSNDSKFQSKNVEERSSRKKSINLDFTNSISKSVSVSKELEHHTVSCNDDLPKETTELEKEAKVNMLKNNAIISLGKNKHDSKSANNKDETPEKELNKKISFTGKRKKNNSPRKQEKSPITRKRNQMKNINNVEDPRNELDSTIKLPNKEITNKVKAASKSEKLLEKNSAEKLKCKTMKQIDNDLNISIYNGEHDKMNSPSTNGKQFNARNIQTKKKEQIDTLPSDEVLLSKNFDMPQGNKVKLCEKILKSDTNKIVTAGESCSVVITYADRLLADDMLHISDSCNVNSNNKKSLPEDTKMKPKKSQKRKSSSRARKSFSFSNEISAKSHLAETNSKVIVTDNLDTVDETNEILSETCHIELVKETSSIDENKTNSFTLDDTNDSDILYEVNNFDVLDNTTNSNTLGKVDEAVMFNKSDSPVDSNEIDSNNSNKTNSSTILNGNDNSVMLSKIYDPDEMDESVMLNEINNQVILEELNDSSMLNEMEESLILNEIDISISSDAIDSNKLNKTSDMLNVNDSVLLKDNAVTLNENNGSDNLDNSIREFVKLHEPDDSINLNLLDDPIKLNKTDSIKKHEQPLIFDKESNCLTINDAVAGIQIEKGNSLKLGVLNDSNNLDNIQEFVKLHEVDNSIHLGIIDDPLKLNKADSIKKLDQPMILDKESNCLILSEVGIAIPIEKKNSPKFGVFEDSGTLKKFDSSIKFDNTDSTISIVCEEKNELLENKDPSVVNIADSQVRNDTDCLLSTNIAKKLSLILSKPDQELFVPNLNNLETLDQIDSLLLSEEPKSAIFNKTVCSTRVNDTDSLNLNKEIKSISLKAPVIESREVLQNLVLNTTTEEDNTVRNVKTDALVSDSSNLIKCQKSKKSCKRSSFVLNHKHKAKKSFIHSNISDNNKYEDETELFEYRRLMKYNKMKKRKFREFIENQKRKSYSDSDSTDENEHFTKQNRSTNSAFKSFQPHLLSSSQKNFTTDFHSNVANRENFSKTWCKMGSSFRVAKKSLVKSISFVDNPLKPARNRAVKSAVPLLRKDEHSASGYSTPTKAMTSENGFNLIGNEVADFEDCKEINHSESEPEIVFETAGVDQGSDCEDMGNKSFTFSRSSSPIKDMVLFKINCSCTAESVTINSLDAAFEDDCQGKDSVNGEIIPCTQTVSQHELLSPSSNLPFFKYCDVHKWRLRQHHCCPECGIFCTQGTFIMCLAQLPGDGENTCHLFHKDCFNILNPGLPPGCPHCSRFSDFKVVTLEDKTNDLISTGVPDLAADETNITSELGNCCILMKDISSKESEISEDSPLYVPCKKEVQSMIMTLAKEKALQLKPSGKCLYVPVKVGDAEKVLQMIAIGVNPNQRFEMYNNNTPLHIACSHGFKDIVHILIQAGALVDAVNNDLYTPLMLAVSKGFTRIVQHLIRAGARVELRGEDGMTCFHLATRNGDLKTAQLLYETGSVDIDAQDEGGWTPFVWACEHSHLDVIKWLLEIGADINVRDNEENVSLHWAAYSGEENVVAALLDYGCNLNAVNKLGDSPIHIAARKDHYKCVKLLAYKGASLDKKNKEDMSPIMCCPDSTTRSYRTLKSLKSVSLAKLKKLVSDQNIVIRDISRGKEVYPVQVINEIDEEEFIMDFRYVLGNCCTTLIDINITVHKMQMCYCQDNCSSSQCICSSSSVQCWYDVDGHLISDFDMFDPPAIFECNKTCHCPKTCINRVVQHGLRFPLQLFRTYSKGWGVRSLKSIRKGAFVCEYVGELITNAVANERENDTYLFDLGNSDESYCLDTQFYGNVSRFLNHSCDPNLIALKVFVEHQDLNFPRIAFFALRDIDSFEELCFDYGINFWIIKCRYQLCTCGSSYCKYSRNSIDSTLEQYAIQNMPS